VNIFMSFGNFHSTVSSWRQQTVGAGALLPSTTGLLLYSAPTTDDHYSNAQLDDTQGLPRSHFPWRPPLTLRVRARFSPQAALWRGTAGFGFWNDPFAMSGSQGFSLPRALWFFFNGADAPMQLARETPGHGWRAATLDAWRLPFLLLAPTAPLAMLLMRWRALYQVCWPLAQWAMGVCEAPVPVDRTTWHTYTIHWGRRSASFAVDDRWILHCKTPPGGPLGLVLWLDNQGISLAPWQLPRHGLFANEQGHWLELAWLELST
jgi:hypothetical protein